MIEGTDYLDTSNKSFTAIQNYGGVYLLAPEFIYKNGCCKVGLCTKLGHRMGFYRSAYAWFSPIYIFGLIVIEEKKGQRQIEAKILKDFNDIRVPFLPYKGRGSRDSEWLVIDSRKIKEVFKSYEGKPKIKVITCFKGLDKAPFPDIKAKILKKLPRGKFLVEFADGHEDKVSADLLRRTVNMPKIKDTYPLWVKYKWITQEQADDILKEILKKTRVEINRLGGLYVYYEEQLKQRVALNRSKRLKKT